MSVVCVLILWTLFSQNDAPAEPDEPEAPEREADVTYDVSIDFPDSSRDDYADVAAVNSRGSKYNYRIFNQKAGYDTYSGYLSAHGCSTCALTSILRNIEGLEDLTPDRCLEEILTETAGDEVFDANFSKSAKRQMPVTLYGAKKVFEKYGVSYQLPSSDAKKREKEITAWLKAGDPVLFTFGNGSSAGLSRHTHTVLLLGIDDDGYVIIGDSLHKSAARWGSQGLVKTGQLTVADMLSFIKKDGEWSVCNDDTDSSHFFYKNSSDRGYLLVRVSGEPAESAGTDNDNAGGADSGADGGAGEDAAG